MKILLVLAIASTLGVANAKSSDDGRTCKGEMDVLSKCLVKKPECKHVRYNTNFAEFRAWVLLKVQKIYLPTYGEPMRLTSEKRYAVDHAYRISNAEENEDIRRNAKKICEDKAEDTLIRYDLCK